MGVAAWLAWRSNVIILTDEQAAELDTILEVVAQKGLTLLEDVEAVTRAGIKPGEIGTSVSRLRLLQEVLRGK
jgi:hypothetical protein